MKTKKTPANIPDRERSMVLIADVYVYNNKNLNVAVGHADDIFVVAPIKGEYYIARGAIFSYYEFTGKLYNDEEWRSLIQKRIEPDRPAWIKPLPLKESMIDLQKVSVDLKRVYGLPLSQINRE
jgi:hypothetical protein